MNSFDNREKAEENKYAHDMEVEFLVNARYHKLLALWVAEKAGFDAEKIESYKKSFVFETLDTSNAEAIYAKLKHELLMHDIHISEHNIREEMHNILQTARKQVMERD